jgi:hypothetical protein
MTFVSKHYWGKNPDRKDVDPKTGKQRPGKPHKHTWTPIFDDDGNIIGKVCTNITCGEQQGG